MFFQRWTLIFLLFNVCLGTRKKFKSSKFAVKKIENAILRLEKYITSQINQMQNSLAKIQIQYEDIAQVLEEIQRKPSTTTQAISGTTTPITPALIPLLPISASTTPPLTVSSISTTKTLSSTTPTSINLLSTTASPTVTPTSTTVQSTTSSMVVPPSVLTTITAPPLTTASSTILLATSTSRTLLSSTPPATSTSTTPLSIAPLSTTLSTTTLLYKILKPPTKIVIASTDCEEKIHFGSSACNKNVFEGEWTVILNRAGVEENFNRSWNEYIQGFGNPKHDFWLGLDDIHHRTSKEPSELLIALIDQNDRELYAHYKKFKVGNETVGYPIEELDGFSGNAGDFFSENIGQKFTTRDTTGNCSAEHGEVGWWFKKCGSSVLTGRPLLNRSENFSITGILWGQNHVYYNFKAASMMIRPSQK